MTKKAVFLSNLGQLILSYAENKKGRPMPSVKQKPSFEAQITAFENIINSQENPDRKKFLKYCLSVLVHIQRLPDSERSWKSSNGTDVKKMIAAFLFFSSNIATSYLAFEFKQIYKSYKLKANHQEESELLTLHVLSFRSSLRQLLLDLILKDPTPGLELEQYQNYVESMVNERAETEAKLDSEPEIVSEPGSEVEVSEEEVVVRVESPPSPNQTAAQLAELKRKLSAKEQQEEQNQQRHAEEIAELTQRAEAAEKARTDLQTELLDIQTLLTTTQHNLEQAQQSHKESKEGREHIEGLLKSFFTIKKGDKKRPEILEQLKELLLPKKPEAMEAKEVAVQKGQVEKIELEGEPSSSSEENLLRTSAAQLRRTGSFGSSIGNRATITTKNDQEPLRPNS